MRFFVYKIKNMAYFLYYFLRNRGSDAQREATCEERLFLDTVTSKREIIFLENPFAAD